MDFKDSLNKQLEDEKLRKAYEALQEEYEGIERGLRQKVCNDSWDDVGIGCFAYWDRE
jgi:hypothetical protein